LNESITEKLRPKALEFLRNSGMPVGVGDVAKHLKVSWSTGRQVLNELMLDGEVEYEKTTKSKIFRIKKQKRGSNDGKLSRHQQRTAKEDT
jgi:predicted ArsR family transcriptional regulator